MSMADLSQILARLRAGGGVAAGLAAAIVDDVLQRPVEELLGAHSLAGAVREGLVALTTSDSATQRITERLQGASRALSAEKRTTEAIVPSALADGMRGFARLPSAPSRDALLKVLDRPPVRRMLRAQVIETLAAFGRRAASPVSDSSLARGLGGISKRALGQIASGPGALSRVASAVSSEVERQVERRATDFADTAVAGILAGIVDQAADPARRDEQAAVRIALVDGLLEMTGAELAGLSPGDAVSQVEVARSALAAWATQPDFVRSLESALEAVLAEDAHRPLGDLLADFAIRDTVVKHATGVVEHAIARLVAGPAFERWLTELVARE
ncbi:MAG: hypothetical protein ACLP1X_09905 [Polyangiaceae bacterium]|jgi:hypothetical protein